MASRLYLDHAATTPVLPQARAAMSAALDRWANPSSLHEEGRAARAALEEARGRIADALGWRHAIVFTSGASEAIAIAMAGAVYRHRAISAVEHDAVRRVAGEARILPVDERGHVIVTPADVGDALVAVQSVNNETGIVQPLDDIGEIVRDNAGLLLADCAQSAGKLPLPEADFIAISAHKLGGPPGIGALLVRDPALLRATGGQEQGYRGGTENVPAILGFAAALDARRDWLSRAAELRQQLERVLIQAGGEVIGADVARLPTIGAYRMPGTPATTQLIRLDLAGIAVSAGSACSSGSMKPSHVLAAMGFPEMQAREVIRVSFGPATSRADIYRFTEAWAEISREMKARHA